MFNKIMILSALGASICLGFMMSVQAESSTQPISEAEERINQEQIAQAKLIRQGIRRGALTFEEVELLSKEQLAIQQLKKSMKEKSKSLSEAEIYQLLRLLSRAEYNIIREITDDERRWRR